MEMQISELLSEALAQLEYVNRSNDITLPAWAGTALGKAEALVKLALEVELDDLTLPLPDDGDYLLDGLNVIVDTDPEIPCE